MTDREELLWRQYELQVGLFKEYLNLVLKVNGFYYVATGALVSFYLSKPQVPWMKYSLAFPAPRFGLCPMAVTDQARRTDGKTAATRRLAH